MDKTTLGIANFESKTFNIFYTCLGFLLMKMIFMVPLTGRVRFLKKVVISPEDQIFRKGLKVVYDDPDVERVRRAHLNDVENILVFINVAFVYLFLEPNPIIAIPLLISYTVARYIHTFVYCIVVKPQPYRFLSYAVGYLITCYMAGYIIFSLKDAM